MNWTKLTLTAAMLAASAFAQGPFGVMTANTPPDPATIVQNRVSRLTSLLSLTAAQVTQATSIFTAAQNSVTPLQTSLDGYRPSLQSAVRSNSTATIDSLSASIGTAYGQVTAIQNKADAAFYAILTAAQQATLTASGGAGGGGRGPRP
jgi:Spy/CpxP family protein refolding chaperone